jgi:iron complex outermembrane recepter protein
MHNPPNTKRLGLLAGASLALTAFVSAPPAFAQEEGASAIDEIVVTARRREENLQDTPIAISAFSADDIAARGMNDLSNVAASTPNLAFATAPQNGNKGSASVFLRGVGQLDYTMFTDPGVGIYVDDVYVARSIGSMLDFTDIERVEVLRGPQGTLFGRNTIGGAIRVISAQPNAEPGGSVTYTTGSYDRMQVQATANLPLSDTLFSRVTLFGHLREGYMTRVQTGDDVGDDNVWGGRAQFRWEPTENFSASLSLDSTTRDENAGPLKLLDAAGFGFSGGGANPIPIDQRNVTAQVPPLPPGLGPNPPSVFNALILGGACATYPTVDTSQNCWGRAWVTSDPYTTNDTFGDRTTLDVFGANLTLDWDLGFMDVKSITAHRQLEAFFVRDTDHSPFDLFSLTFDDEQEQFSQEFQFTGDVGDRFDWLLGVYYFNETGTEIYDNFNRTSFDGVATINLENRSLAVFTENTLDLTETLHLTAGVRWTRDEKDFSIFYPVVIDFNGPAPPNVGQYVVGIAAPAPAVSSSVERVTPRVTLAWDVSDDIMAYATYSEGYKSGGFNGRYTGFVPAVIPFSPEFVTQYEAGVKFETSNLRLNLSAFRSDYTDIQVNYRPNPLQILTIIGNAAAAEINGVEAEFKFVPMEGLTFEGGVGWIDAAYTEVDPGLAVAGINLTTPFVNTPELSGSLAVSYEHTFGDGSTLTPRFDYSYRDNVVLDNTNSPPARQDAVGTLNANITWRSSDENWRIIFGGTNLTEEVYLVSAAYNRAAGVAEGLYGRPREWYLSARRSF